jgi:hypothetical protein
MKEIILIIGNKSYSPWSLRVWFFMKQFNLNFVERKVQLCTLLLFQTFPQSKNKNQKTHTNPNWHNDFNQKTVSPIR